jgi:phosphate:Na+ symporter
VTFKIVGVLLIVGFIPQLAEFVRYISPAEAGLTGLDKLAAETPRQIANAHTIFNIGIAFTFLPMAGLFARFCEWIVPDKPMEAVDAVQNRYLDEELLGTPRLALDAARREIGRAGEVVEDMLEQAMPGIVDGDRETLEKIAEMDDRVDNLHGQIIHYLGRLSQSGLSHKHSQELVDLMAGINDLENIGDLLESDLVELGQKRLNANITIGEQSRNGFSQIGQEVSKAVAMAVQAVVNNDYAMAHEVIRKKDKLNRLVNSATLSEAQRLSAEEPNRLQTYTIEVAIIDKLKRIYYYSKRMAKTVPPPAVIQADFQFRSPRPALGGGL